jgi:hypothetical protein
LELPDGGGSIMVPLAQEEATHSGSGKTYTVKWAQDDAGRLVVLSVAPKQLQGEAQQGSRHQRARQQQPDQATRHGNISNGGRAADGIELPAEAAASCDAVAPPRPQPSQPPPPQLQRSSSGGGVSALLSWRPRRRRQQQQQ